MAISNLTAIESMLSQMRQVAQAAANVPQRNDAVADQQGSFAMLVRADNTIERRNLVLGERIADKVIVNQGMEEGEQVVVRGLQQIRPEQSVTVRALPHSEG